MFNLLFLKNFLEMFFCYYNNCYLKSIDKRLYSNKLIYEFLKFYLIKNDDFEVFLLIIHIM
jgi:hypothetical protein